MMAEREIQIRECNRLGEFDACVDLQQTAWGFADRELVSSEMFIVASKTGGQVFGAFDGEKLVGFVMALAALREGKGYLHSHMLAVLPEYRNLGLGQKLKLRQREDALARGIDLVEWTFDPLALRNARLNIIHLGAIVRRYLRDLYGQTSSPLHAGLPTDRLVAEWWLRSPRVETVLAGGSVKQTTGERIAIPRDIENLRHRDLPRARGIHEETRSAFERLLGQGYAVTGFEFSEGEGVYLLERYED